MSHDPYYRHTKKASWVPVSFLTMVTGWDGEKIRQAREAQIVEVKERPGGKYLYNIDSIHPHFIIKKADASTSANHNQ